MTHMYFSARAEGLISYGHLGRTDSCYYDAVVYQFVACSHWAQSPAVITTPTKYALEFCTGVVMGILPRFLRFSRGCGVNICHGTVTYRVDAGMLRHMEKYRGNRNSFVGFRGCGTSICLSGLRIIIDNWMITYRQAEPAAFLSDCDAIFDLVWPWQRTCLRFF